MKTLHIGGTLVLAAALFTACKKNNNSTPPPSSNGTGALIRIQEGMDADITNDTVYNITYNTSNKISILVDSLNDHDTLVATYDAHGNLTAVTDKGAYPINATYTYDGNNNLTQLDYVLAGSHEQYTFIYTAGVISRQNYLSNLGSGSVALQNYYTYTVSGGNITDIKYYQADGTFTGEATPTYGTQANPFANLSLFNYGNRLGMSDIAPIEAFFNKNIATGASAFGLTSSITNTYDSNKNLTKVVANDQINQWLLTWAFSYK